MTTAPSTDRPTYGNLRRPRSAGLNSFSLLATGLLFAGVLVFVIMSLLGGLIPALIELVAVFVAVGLLSVRDRDGRNLLQRTAARLAYRHGRRSGAHLYRAGLLGVVPHGSTQLPGLAAKSTLAEAWDSYGRPFCAVYYPSTTDYAVTFSAEPDGAALVDDWQVDSWVAYWGAFLASLSDEPGIQAAAVTIETAPDTGHRLHRAVTSAIDEDSPEIARAMLHEVVSRYPAGSAVIRSWVTLTFSAATRATGPRRSTEEVLRDLASRLPKLGERLGTTGAGAVRPTVADELAETVRVAYDPAAASVIEHARVAGEPVALSWDEVGPAAHEARWDHYVHDSGVSRTWTMTVPPRGVFSSNVLTDLLAPHPDIARKRVTLLYRVLPAGKAADVVQSDQRDADFRAATSRPTARARVEAAAAAQAAMEEAKGAGVANVGMIVTATVVDPGAVPGERLTKRNRTREARLLTALADATAAIDSLAAGARIRLRIAYGSQDSAFAAGLPAGPTLTRHLRVPTEVREAL